MKKSLLTAFLIISYVELCQGSTYGRPGLSFKAGIGYDFFSQEYFLDSLTQSGADSLDISTALETTYLKNLKGQMALRYNPFQDYHLEMEGIFEQTSEEQRVRGYSNFRPMLGPVRLDWNSDLDWRWGSTEAETGRTGYFSGSSRLKGSFPLSASLSLWSRLKAEKVSFDSSAWGALDHHRLGGEIGVSHNFGEFSSLSGSGFIARRFVPDSHDQEYRSFGFDGSAFLIYEKGELDILAHWESRDYAKPENLDDYQRIDLDLRHRHSFSSRYFIRGEGQLEITSFDSTDYLTTSYSRLELSVLAGISVNMGSVAIGPRVETLSEGQVDPGMIGEDYVEFGIKGQLDLISPGWPFVSFESVTGRRNLQDVVISDGLHSDFTGERLSLLVDWLVAAHFNVNLLFSADWEWHDNPEENSRLLLFSSGVTYSF